MATDVVSGLDLPMENGTHEEAAAYNDPFLDGEASAQGTKLHRYSSHFDPEMFTLAGASSPSQVKRNLEAHLSETERRLEDTQKLGKSLLDQKKELSDRLTEVNQQQDETEITPELRHRLAELEKEHNDVGKEIARALIAPKSRNVSGEDKPVSESPATFSSNATGSPTKVTAPSRKQRNQPANRVGDIQFAADISTSLLAQVRQMQAMLAERDEALKNATMEKSRLEHEAEGFGQRLRVLDENEQRYKDENWNLETQNHELLAAAREAADREKRLNAGLAVALAEKSRHQNELDEVKVAHGKLTEDHVAAKKAHDSEIHGLKRTMDLGENERDVLQSQIDELTMQNQELARGMASRLRSQNGGIDEGFDAGEDEATRDFSTPEHSPPPSPTKATPRHGGLESETLKSSLHHAHRMIQNLKGNIHREKTEKIELKRMLQDARDELEQRRDGGLGSGSKRQKTKPEAFKKPLRPDMLGGSRRSRTDVEFEEQDWEDHAADSPSQAAGSRGLAVPVGTGGSRLTDVSDAYQTANETEGAFETADERHGTESEDFQTGAESLAGDSTDELTETEDNVGGNGRSSQPLRQAGNRSSYLSTASTSAGEEEDDLRTPIQTVAQKFRLKNGRSSFARQSRLQRESTPESYHDLVTAQDSPAALSDRSPPAAEQSLFAELGGLDDASSDRYSTPGRASIISQKSTPGAAYTGGARSIRDSTPAQPPKAPMVDSSTMTEPWEPEVKTPTQHGLRDGAAGAAVGGLAGYAFHDHQFPPASPSDFPLPPSVPNSPPRKTDTSTQYTPSRGLQDSPMRNAPNFITPPKTVWDEEQDESQTPQGYSAGTAMTPQRPLGYSGVLAQGTSPVVPEKSLARPPSLAFSSIQAQETKPIAPPVPLSDSPTLAASDMSLHSRPRTAEKVAAGAAAGGVLATAAGLLGFSKSKEPNTPVIAEDRTSQDTPITPTAGSKRAPFRDVSGNTGTPVLPSDRKAGTGLDENALVTVSSNDQGSQTMLTSQQIDEALRSKMSPQAVVALPTSQPGSPTPRSPSKHRDSSSLAEAAPLIASASALKRPTSANSGRTPSFTTSHPPLPTDHKKVIARVSRDINASSPTHEPSNSSHVASIMGPPIAPASAYRRPRTPAESSRTPTRDGTTPRASRWRSGNTINSNLSRRSSISSFASDLDERFNIRTDAPTASHGFEHSANTDPRMIQAITQTMIGEFLFKYTRKPGSTDMSSTRHKRYFWVHPYTKTLYWSNSDPQSAGRTELKAKSVQISSVRVVTDDNAFPPGLHRKSLEIVAPGRKVKVTAPTSQRHETWFNALSYLLLRGEDPTNHGSYATGGNEITDADVDEFKVSGYGGTRSGAGGPSDSRSRSLVRPSGISRGASVSSYNSRGTSANRSVVRMPTTVSTAASRMPTNQSGTATSRATVVRHDSNQGQLHQSRSQQDRDRTVRASSVSRFSRMLGSVTGRTKNAEAGTATSEAAGTGAGNEGSIYNASVVSDGRLDSAEELRRELLRQERDSDRLENVRACCDGKHDVSTLAGGHGGRHPSNASGSHRHSNIDRINRSVNRRAVGTLTGPSAGTSAKGAVQVGG